MKPEPPKREKIQDALAVCERATKGIEMSTRCAIITIWEQGNVNNVERLESTEEQGISANHARLPLPENGEKTIPKRPANYGLLAEIGAGKETQDLRRAESVSREPTIQHTIDSSTQKDSRGCGVVPSRESNLEVWSKNLPASASIVVVLLNADSPQVTREDLTMLLREQGVENIESKTWSYAVAPVMRLSLVDDFIALTRDPQIGYEALLRAYDEAMKRFRSFHDWVHPHHNWEVCPCVNAVEIRTYFGAPAQEKEQAK